MNRRTGAHGPAVQHRSRAERVVDEGRPIFLQLAEQIEDDIIDGRHPEETQIPSTNEFAAYLRINPATAGKGVNLLVDAGILYKKRGIGMFVAEGARARIVTQRRERFRDQYVGPLLAEAEKLGIDSEQLATMIRTTPPSPTTANGASA